MLNEKINRNPDLWKKTYYTEYPFTLVSQLRNWNLIEVIIRNCWVRNDFFFSEKWNVCIIFIVQNKTFLCLMLHHTVTGKETLKEISFNKTNSKISLMPEIIEFFSISNTLGFNNFYEPGKIRGQLIFSYCSNGIL